MVEVVITKGRKAWIAKCQEDSYKDVHSSLDNLRVRAQRHSEKAHGNQEVYFSFE